MIYNEGTNLFPLKRVNFYMAPECHALLKSVCALKNITVSEYVYDLIKVDFEYLLDTEPQVRYMFLAADYPDGSNAQRLKNKIIDATMSK